MRFKVFKNTALLFVLIVIACASKSNDKAIETDITKELSKADNSISVGANRTENYLSLLQGKRVGLVANQTSVIFREKVRKFAALNYMHIVDSLLQRNINIKKVFSPEHGFRGTADAGENVKDGLEIISLL